MAKYYSHDFSLNTSQSSQDTINLLSSASLTSSSSLLTGSVVGRSKGGLAAAGAAVAARLAMTISV